jgi:nucleoside-diphosphate-sugar epimerase
MIKIIGGSGFIGTRLSKRLEVNSIEFSIIDKVVSKTFAEKSSIADVRDVNSLISCLNREDIIINLAAEHRDDVTPKSLYDDVNVEGAKNVCEAAKNKDINTIIFTSSVAVYGFAPINTDESGRFNPFNDYGRTKLEAEYVYKEWQNEDPINRKLIIIRPTVVFGEQNRGNVYNLLKQISSGNFIMLGKGKNKKSMAYVENVAALLEYSIDFNQGVHIYNYIDKPNLDMNTLIKQTRRTLGKKEKVWIRLPYIIGYFIGKTADLISVVSGKKFNISSIRIKKFCSDSIFETTVSKTGFIPPYTLEEGLKNTLEYEFLNEKNKNLEV